MERQPLICLIFIFALSSCQTSGIPTSSIEQKIEISEKSIETEIQYTNIWDYIVKNSDTHKETYLDDVTLEFINKHLKNKDNFDEYLSNSYFFIYYVVQELEAANLPVELALIPFIESNYDPFSISPSGAVGLWQFMPKTGRFYNLEKSWWNEDRHDPYRSTHAAIGYFKYLFDRFDNDIYLALAAYNAGPARVDGWVTGDLNFDQWLDSLPYKETRDYVQAVMSYSVIYHSNAGIDYRMLNEKERLWNY